MSKRKFLVSFACQNKGGFGFGNWETITEGGLIDLSNAYQFAEEIKVKNGYESIVILSISEVLA